MNFFDKAMSAVLPVWARWAHQRDQLLLLNAYEAARGGRTRRGPEEPNSGNVAVERASESIRRQARGLDQNHDVAKGILNSLVNKVVGPNGIGVEFMPKTTSGEIASDVAQELSERFTRWSKRPEATKEYSRARAERLMCRSWLRDGELFVKKIEGNARGYTHSSETPFSFEMLEADLVPFQMLRKSDNIIQGVEINAWGQRVAYHILKDHPGDWGAYAMDTKRIMASKVLHPRFCDRIHQLRGVSIFASVLTRLQDIKDYEESERVAARIAAAMAAYVRKGEPHMYTVKQDEGERQIKMAPGLVFDNLRPGEEIGTINHNRPNPNLGNFRADMLKATAAGTGSQYSTIAKNYDGNYSSQRQELIEQQANYLVLTDDFIDQLTAPLVESFIRMEIVRGLGLPADIDRETLFDVEYQGPALPWIDPVKEAQGYLQLVKAGFTSKTKVVRMLGGNPQRVSQQIRDERQQDDASDLVFTSDYKHEVQKNAEAQVVRN